MKDFDIKDLRKPAFPVPDDASEEPGMTLRDYFAAKAMQGFIIANLYSNHMQVSYSTACREMALDAYELADAMLEIGK